MKKHFFQNKNAHKPYKAIIKNLISDDIDISIDS